MTKQEWLLTQLADECVEAAQRCHKAIQFGLNEVQEGQELTNADRLHQELTDIHAVIEMLANQNMISEYFLSSAVLTKKQKVLKHMEYAIQIGIINE